MTAPAPPPELVSIAHLRLKVAALLLAVALLLSAAVVYLLYARGAFEVTQQLVLVAEDSEGVVVGMDLTFSGFPIGRVSRIELAPDGNARIVVEIPKKDAHWLRVSSVFTLQRGVLGNTNIRAHSGMLSDPPLPHGAVRQVLKGDSTAEIPRMMASVRELVQNIVALTAPDAPMNEGLANLREVTERLKGPRGALGVLLGNEKDAQKLILAIERTNALLARIDSVAARSDGLIARADGLIARTDTLMARADQVAAKADEQLFGKDGLAADSKATLEQLRGLLGEARGNLQRIDAVLQDAQVIGSNARVASTDLGALRSEIEANLRKIEHLVNEINRKWPFARDTQIKLP